MKDIGSARGPRPEDSTTGEVTVAAPPLVLPSGPLVANVFGQVPQQPLDVLIPFVEADRRDGQVIDWLLTSDVIAFAEPEIPQLFVQWRESWVRSWTLEPLASIRTLHLVGAEVPSAPEVDTWRATIGRVLDSGRPSAVQTDDLPAIRTACETLRDFVRERDATGFGIVDATPGRTTPGLVSAWSSKGADHLVARDEHLEAWFTADRGLVVKPLSTTNRDEMVVSGVQLTDDVVVVGTNDERWEIAPDRARALSWLVPGSSQWRVREIPEVVVWAKTFAGLPECCDYAMDRDASVQLTVEAPVQPVSTARSEA